MSEKNTDSELPGWITEHVQLYREDPEKGHMWDSTFAGGPGLLPTLLLSTTGRKSGRTSVLPLIYKKVNNGYVIIASKGGAPAHPAWYLNLVADPNCEIQIAQPAPQRAMSANRCGSNWQKSTLRIRTTRRQPIARSRLWYSIQWSEFPVAVVRHPLWESSVLLFGAV